MTRPGPLRLGILGTGRMAAAMAAALPRQPGAELAAVGSADAGRARAFAGRFAIPRWHGDLAAFCADPDIDLVYVANASRHHAASSCAALRAGRAVLCEKPFALTREEGRQVALAARQGGGFFMEAFWTLCLPAYRRLAELAAGGFAGEPRLLDFSFGYPAHAADLGRLHAAADGGLLFDRAGYGAVLALQLLGPPLAGAEGTGAAGDARTLALRIRHRGGGLSQVAVSAEALLPNRVALGCTAGALGLEPPALGAEALWRVQAAAAPLSAGDGRGLRHRLRGLALLRRLNAARTRPAREWLPYGRGPHDPMLAHVLQRVRAGAAGSDLVPLSLSLAALDLLATAAERLGEGPGREGTARP